MAGADRLIEVFNEAKVRPAGPERDGFLAQACRDDAELKKQVLSLLQAHEGAGEFLRAGPALSPEIEAELARLKPEEAGERIGPYKLREQIGEGGFGVVWVAEQQEPVRRTVALKIIKMGMDTREVVARFEQERQALAMMDHPNIARVFDAGATEHGRPFFVMELVRGIKITDYCDQANLPTAGRLALFITVCQAVQHAHQKGVIHRDLKPSNILVTLHDGVPVPKVIDFGVAKATQGRLTDQTVYTQFQQMIGTPLYMSPEQAEMSGLDVDTRTDIYALGVLLYELLTGRTPFDAAVFLKAGRDEMRRIIREDEPQKPSTALHTMAQEKLTSVAHHRASEPPKLIHAIDGDLDWIVMKALEKDRSRRYETANDLAMDIKRHLGNEPVVARPPSARYRFQKLIRRNKLAFAVGSVATLAVLMAFAGISWQWRRAEQTARDLRRSSFASEMNLAQREWDQDNIVRLRQLLDNTQGYPDRGFEWYFWQRQIHLDLKTFRGHTELVGCVAFSPDGKRIVTGSHDRTAKVWDTETGRQLLTFNGHAGWVYSVAFSPDGLKIVSAGEDRLAKVWEADTGRELLALKGHSAPISSATFSPDGQWIATASEDRTAKVWHATSGKESLTLKGHTDELWTIAFSPDGKRLVTGGVEHDARVWDIAAGRELFTLKGHTGSITDAAFSRDGRIVTCSADSTARLWDASDGGEVVAFKGHSATIRSVVFSRDGHRIVTGSHDGTARIWDTTTARELFSLKGHTTRVFSVAFSPDDQQIATVSEDCTAKLWEANNRGQVLTLTGHTGPIWAATFSPDGRRFVTGSSDQTAKVWEVGNDRELLTLKGHRGLIWCAAFSPDGEQIVTGSEDQTVRIWDARTGLQLSVLTGHPTPVWSVAFAPDGRRIVTGSFDRIARVFDIASQKELLALGGHTGPVSSVAFSPDGKRIVTGSEDGTAKVWNSDNGRVMLTLDGHDGAIRGVAFSPDGERLVTACLDNTARIWDAHSGRIVLALEGHTAPVSSAAFSPDGRRVITGSRDNTARLWCTDSGREVITLKTHAGEVWAVGFSPDGRRIVVGSEDATVRVWEAASAKQVAVWQDEERTAAGYLMVAQRERNAHRERERARSTGHPIAIRQWLILAPIPLGTLSGPDALDQEQIPAESQIRARAGDRVNLDDTEFTWRPVELDGDVIDFSRILGRLAVRSVGYAVCYLHTETEHTGLLLQMGSDDQAKVYLNGQRVLECRFARSFNEDQDTVENVRLNRGLNVLVLKVVNEYADWKCCIRFGDANGQAVKGITVRLTP